MKIKVLLLAGVIMASMVLAGCTPPGLASATGSGQEETEVAGAPDPEDTVEPGETPEVTEAPEETETPEVTETPDESETPEATETEDVDDDGGRAGCPGNPGTAPTAAGSLANANGVTEDEIMGWFCQGFGLGEIKKVYAWAAANGMTVDELFALKASGMGWGEIAKSLDIKPGGKPCWAGSDHGASDVTCVKPGKSGENGEKGNKNDKGEKGNKGNKGGNGNGNGNGGK